MQTVTELQRDYDDLLQEIAAQAQELHPWRVWGVRRWAGLLWGPLLWVGFWWMIFFSLNSQAPPGNQVGWLGCGGLSILTLLPPAFGWLLLCGG